MAVYVDAIFSWPIHCTANAQARRVAVRNNGKWCHMWADTPAELHRLARRIGLKRAWAQHEGTARLHYDLTPGMRAKAITAGALERTTLDWSDKIHQLAEKAATQKGLAFSEPDQEALQ